MMKLFIVNTILLGFTQYLYAYEGFIVIPIVHVCLSAIFGFIIIIKLIKDNGL
jgi:hypothetical protein